MIGKSNTFDWKEFITGKFGHRVIEIEPFHSTKINGRKVGGKNNKATIYTDNVIRAIKSRSYKADGAKWPLKRSATH